MQGHHDQTQPANHHVLVVDDDPGIRVILRSEFERCGYRVTEAGTGAEAEIEIDLRRPDAVLLDLGLPDTSGLDLLSRWSRQDDRLGVLVISGRGGEVDRCVGLESGADDYLVKPFSIRELMVRVEKVIAHSRHHSESFIDLGPLTLDTATREVTVDDRAVELTTKEFDLLALLASSPRRVFGREQILRLVWTSSLEWQSTDTISEHVHRIRRKLDPGDRERFIQTLRGVGYRFCTRHDVVTNRAHSGSWHPAGRP